MLRWTVTLCLATAVFGAVDITAIETSRDTLSPEQYLDIFAQWIRAYDKTYELAAIPSRFATFKVRIQLLALRSLRVRAGEP